MRPVPERIGEGWIDRSRPASSGLTRRGRILYAHVTWTQPDGALIRRQFSTGVRVGGDAEAARELAARVVEAWREARPPPSEPLQEEPEPELQPEPAPDPGGPDFSGRSGLYLAERAGLVALADGVAEIPEPAPRVAALPEPAPVDLVPEDEPTEILARGALAGMAASSRLRAEPEETREAPEPAPELAPESEPSGLAELAPEPAPESESATDLELQAEPVVVAGSGPLAELPPEPDRAARGAALIVPTATPEEIALWRASAQAETEEGYVPTSLEQRFLARLGWHGSRAQVEAWVAAQPWRWVGPLPLPEGPGLDWATLLLVSPLVAVSAVGSAVGWGWVLPYAWLGWIVALPLAGLSLALLWGVGGQEMPRAVRVGVVMALAAASVATEFPVVYGRAAGSAELDRAASTAAAAHGALAGELLPPLRAAAVEARTHADGLRAQAEQERTTGRTSGRSGAGPIVARLEERATRADARAVLLEERVAGLRPYSDLGGEETPQEVYDLAVGLWREADGAAAGVPLPERSTYVEESAETPVLRAWIRLAAGEAEAWIALLIALAIDGAAVIGSWARGPVARRPDRVPDPLVTRVARRVGRQLGGVVDAWQILRASARGTSSGSAIPFLPGSEPR